MHNLSPKYIADLVKKISTTIWDTYKSYDMVKSYISKWQNGIMTMTIVVL